MKWRPGKNRTNGRLHGQHDVGGMRILVTAGPTREYLDTVRFLSNASSGRLGAALAAEAARRGHVVTLIHGPMEIPPPRNVASIAVTSASEMLMACLSAWRRNDALIMTAAVADYTPARTSGYKLKKSSATLTIRLKRTKDILAMLSRRRKPGQVVVGFALEDRDGRRYAESKMMRKGLDAIVLNGPSNIAAKDAVVSVRVRGQDWQDWGRLEKRRLAGRLLKLVETLRDEGMTSR